MTKIKTLIAALALTGFAASAHAAPVLVAGWDFSQYDPGNPNILTVDGQNLTDTLSANYSDFDNTGVSGVASVFHAGPQSAPFGTLYMNGANGSTAITLAGDGSEPFLPIAGSLLSNGSTPTPAPFNSGNVLLNEGQQFFQDARMRASRTVSVVFGAQTGGAQGSGWSISFAGQTFNGTANVTVEFSTDGTSYAQIGSAALNTVDTKFTVAADPSTGSGSAFFRLIFDTTGQGTLDNVAVQANLPEPATAALLATGLFGLVSYGRRRS